MWSSDWCWLHVRDPHWLRVGETIVGKTQSAGLSLPNLLLHAREGVSNEHEGNLRWIGVTSLCEGAFVWVKPNTSIWITWHAGCNWDVDAEKIVELLRVSIPRHSHEISSQYPPPLPSPSSFSSRRSDILYSLHFWPTVLCNGFQTLQGGPNPCQSWKWKANTSPPASVPT